jgi:hypothetical protein
MLCSGFGPCGRYILSQASEITTYRFQRLEQGVAHAATLVLFVRRV